MTKTHHAQLDMEHLKQTLLDHHYELQEQIGEGGGGTVFLVRSQKYSELFVVKSIPVRATEEVTSEVEVLMNFQHPNIINMYEYWSDKDNLYVILEYCPNGSLKDYLKKHGPLSPKQLWHVCKDLASAIEYCHANDVVHRDIKPANLLIDKYERVKLADFGISVQGPSHVNKVAGSPGYMSPETLTGRDNVDPFKCDIWAFGVTLFELSTGVLPWTSRTITDMKREILLGLQKRPRTSDYSFCKLLKQVMDPDPEARLNITQVMKSEYFVHKHDMKSPLPKPSLRPREMKLLTCGRALETFSGNTLEHFPPLNAGQTQREGRIGLGDTKRTGTFLSFLMTGNSGSTSTFLVTKRHSWHHVPCRSSLEAGP